MNGKEIERQWIAEKGIAFQELEEISPSEIEQFYAKITDKEEVRYRKEKQAGNGHYMYKMTVKNGLGLTRGEKEVLITREEFQKALADEKIDGSMIVKKKRITWIINGFRYDVDLFEQPEFDKIAVEVEFDDEGKAKGFELMPDVVPSYFKNPVDVTYDEQWKMKNVALNGFPETV